MHARRTNLMALTRMIYRGDLSRRRTGIEPAGDLFDPPPVLKTGEPTRRSLASNMCRLPKEVWYRDWIMNGGGRGDEKIPALQVTGLVERPLQWRPKDLAALPGQVAGPEGSGVAVRALLETSGPAGGFVSVESRDGSYRASIPLEELVSKGVVVYGLDDGGLPKDRGGPFRMLVPGGRTLCWNVKGVALMRVTAEPEPDSVPANPTH